MISAEFLLTCDHLLSYLPTYFPGYSERKRTRKRRTGEKKRSDRRLGFNWTKSDRFLRCVILHDPIILIYFLRILTASVFKNCAEHAVCA